MPKSSQTGAALSWSFILGGFISQLASAYYEVIRGPLLPSLMQSLGLEFTQSGSFFATGHTAAAAATVTMIWLLNRWTERTLLLAIGALGVVGGLWAQAVGGFAGLLLLAGLIGAAVTSLGTLATILVVEGSPGPLQARFLAALHSTYGIGCMAGATVVGFGLAHGLAWPQFFGFAVPVYGGLMVYAWLKLRSAHRAAAEERTVQSASLSPLQMLVVATFALYVAAEVGTTVWMTSFLVQARQMRAAAATDYVGGFFLVMTLSRLICAALLQPRWEKAVIYAALLVPLVCFALGIEGFTWGFSLMGLCGPFFPVYLARMSRLFPDKWRTVTIWIMVIMNFSVGLFDLVLGLIADLYGMGVAYYMPAMMFVGAALLLSCFMRGERRLAAV